jgi:hypothetical protein
MTTTISTPTKVKPPTRTQIINELLPLRREQMKKEWDAAKEEYDQAEKVVEAQVLEWVEQNPDAWVPHVAVQFYYSSCAIHCYLSDDKPKDGEKGKMQLPPHLLVEQKKLEGLKRKFNLLRNPNHLRDSDIKKLIREELDALDPKSLIDNTTTEKAEEMPVMKEYLEQFMQTLTKVSNARKRLTGNN